MINIITPNLNYENKFPDCKVCGTDEAGRGPWAGPLVVATIIFHNYEDIPENINDSKVLSKNKRDFLYMKIIQKADVAIAIISSNRIDNVGIVNALKMGIKISINKLRTKPDLALIDGNLQPKLNIPSKTIIKGDKKSLSIAAASIIAKVKRDSIMTNLDKIYPGYGWSKNFGYGTYGHRKSIEKLGITTEHRKSFKPITNIRKEFINS